MKGGHEGEVSANVTRVNKIDQAWGHVYLGVQENFLCDKSV